MTEPMNGGRTRAYQALRDSEELHRATLSNMSDAVFLTDDEGRFTFICPNVDVIFGYAPDEVEEMGNIDRLLGRNIFDRRQLARCQEIRNLQREVTSKSGIQRTVLVHVKQVSIKAGTVLYSCRDITECRQAEEELREARLHLTHTSRLALVGELLASIAHEIKQPLASILGNANAAVRLVESGIDDDEVLEILIDVREQARVTAQIIERLRALARRQPFSLRRLDVNDVVSEVLRLVEPDALRRNVSLITELTPGLPPVDADQVSLQQVILNLLANAMEAMSQVNVEERRLLVRTLRSDDAVDVAVSDTGTGIAVEDFPKLFNAFFTTKEDGVGLGLYIARSIIEAHKGRIWATAHAERGATFCFRLPASV